MNSQGIHNFSPVLRAPLDIEEAKKVVDNLLKTKLDKWKFDFDKWTEHIFNPFFESNYKVIKREFKIVFTDDL